MLYEKVFGREKLIAKIMQYLKDHKSIVIHGEEDIGKSTVLKASLKELSEDSIDSVYISSVGNAKPFLQEFCFQLDCELEEKKIFAANTSVSILRNIIRRQIRHVETKVIFFLDLGASSPARGTRDTLIDIFNLGVTFVVAARSLNICKDFLGKFDTNLSIEDFDKDTAYEYIDYITEDWNIEDKDYAKNQIYKKTNGRPGLINKILDKYKDSKEITNKMVDEIPYQQLGIIRYMYPFISIVLIFTLFFNRYLSRVMSKGDRTYYLIGCLGLVIAVLFGRFVLPLLKKEK